MSTVIKYYCDRCGKEIDREHNKVSYVYYDEDDYVNRNQNKDLCKECLTELHRFLNNVPEWV